MFKVRAFKKKDDLLLKTINLINSLKKLLGYVKGKYMEYIKWPFNDCMINVNFHGINYVFYLSKGYDFNIFLNPYLTEYDTLSKIWFLLDKKDIFVDVGAHAGSFTILSGKRAGQDGKIISFEPNPENLKFLKLNVKLNKLKNIHIIPKALGQTKGHLKLHYYPGQTAFTSFKEKDAKRTKFKNFITELTTLDQIYEELIKPNTIKIVKIDTEGYDFQVLQGAIKTLKKIQYLILEQNTNEIRKFLTQFNYKLQVLKPSNYLFAINKHYE